MAADGTAGVLVFDFGGSKVSTAVVGLDGSRRQEATMQTEPARGAGWNLAQAVALGQELLSRAESQLVAIGAATFGIPTPEGTLLAPAIPGWEDVLLAQALADAFGCANVKVGNDVKLAAQAEARTGALVGADPAIYLNLGTGLAVCLVCAGQVLVGANGAAGEIGYSLRQFEDVDTSVGDRARLEDVVSGMALAAAGSRSAARPVSAADVFAGEAGNPAFGAALDSFVQELSFHLVNLVIALDPQKVAIGGGIMRSWPRIRPRLQQALQSAAPFPPVLAAGAYPYDAPLMGAIALALEAADIAGGTAAVATTPPTNLTARPTKTAAQPAKEPPPPVAADKVAPETRPTLPG